MNIFRSLIGKVWHDPNAAEVVKISTGQLYLVRPGNIRSSRECIFNDAMITIRRVPTVEHNFQLVVTRVYEEGDEDLLEDEDETDAERVCLISGELEFHTGVTDGEPTFIWRDLQGDIDELYEFVAIGTNAPTRAFFEMCMYRAMFERKYKRAGDNAVDKELEEFIWQLPTPTKKHTNPKKASRGSPPGKQTSAVKSEDDLPKVEPTPESPGASRASAEYEVNPIATYSALLSVPAGLHQWNTDTENFEPWGDAVARIVQDPDDQYSFYLAATLNDSRFIGHKVTTDMNQKYSKKIFTVTWNNIDRDGSQASWVLQFQNLEDFEAFQKLLGQCMWESLNRLPYAKVKSEEQRYIESANEDVEMADPEYEDEDDEEEVLDELDPDAGGSDEESGPEEDEDDVPEMFTNGDFNSQLTVGYKNDRSYVLRGNTLGVFSHTNDDQVKYYNSIKKIGTPKGKEFKPKHIMLHDQDSKMVLMNPSEPNSLYSLDLTVGKVVEEWKVHDDISVNAVAPDSKYAPTTREQTLIGVSHNALFRIDPRVSGTKLVESQFKNYATKNAFSGVATTDSGKVAVASSKGDIRLYDSIGKNAKTALPPLGDPIVGVDVTADGRWIIATTKTYLLLIDTLIGEGKYQGSLGFDRSFPATAKPMPRRLQLRGEHVAYMKDEINFSPARFNQGEGQQENAIVTSTGKFVVAWDFTKVKRGQLDKYEIKKYEDHVVQDNFKFGDDKNIIVALSNNVLALNKKGLTRPTRKSLGGGLAGSSTIVNSPW
ncbi:VID27 cytoplasmic protein [Pleurotus eryngii]|uniref:VID27 cytoplasmic protein n=1 Tax=Pleurotus eryngii TaxID=5323 RepID=A0A9P5ZR82_PLEER|nr:VID27 cytoplasmic protein [Pleurotus eryngii]